MIAFARDILEVDAENQPGALLEIAGKLHEAGVNIDYAYGSTSDAGQGAMYLGVNDPAAAIDSLK